MVDARGRTTALWTYHSNTATGSAGDATVTSYQYSTGVIATGKPDAGNLAVDTTLSDSAGHQWTKTVNAAGQLVDSTDPDSGEATATYDAEGDVTAATDDAGTRTVSYSYDLLGRKIGLYNGTTQTTANKLASWTYDTATAGLGRQPRNPPTTTAAAGTRRASPATPHWGRADR